ncbi:hypothetical protein C8F01DRAFT_991945 [Mycena amicta]|nr:hypothetical protein C8F01DRAFT_1005119 [Mycena amicta]KAJ7049582.1 hypothetical protein C8F01DRAFT_1002251 [Mycena amicta]KAJ7052694.1 hypothetical protein C8F01DRAFT_997692 [Mycena amicta]KAJ7057428.1 hypothetical protein C8F01DRAFT_991945 [Mycena amicta]
MPDVLPSQPGLGRRPEKYKPTTVDYTAYVQRRNTFLNSSRGRLALFSGGLVARLARLVISDFEDKARIDPSNEELDGGLRVVNKQGDVAVWHEALTPSEIDLICGVYPTETGINGDAQLKYISWFPLPAAFCSSSLHTGWWNVSCERWLQKRLDDISQGKAALYTNHEWRKNIRFHAAAHKIRLALEDISAEYLATRSHVVRL